MIRASSFAIWFLTLALLPADRAAAQVPRAGMVAPPLGVEQYLQAPEAPDLTGRAVVVEFWATWCAPCIRQIPHLNTLAAAFRDEPVTFVSITDEEEATVRDFLKDHPIDTWVGLDADRSVFDAYKIYAIPRTLLIYADGRIAARTYAADVDEAMIADLVAGRPLEKVE